MKFTFVGKFKWKLKKTCLYNFELLMIFKCLPKISLQETMNMLYSGDSSVQRGTLAHLKNFFSHRNVSHDVMNSFNYVDNFIRFTTEAYVTYLALKVCAMSSIEADPHGSVPDADVASRTNYFNDICRRVVNEVWLLPSPTDVGSVIDAELSGRSQDTWCFCEQGLNFILFNTV